MPAMSPVYSRNEPNKPVANRVYHNNSACGAYKAIPPQDRLAGTNGYRLCDDCVEENRLRH